MKRNLGLKIFSIFVAIGLYAYVNSENNASISGTLVPIEIRNLAEGKVLVWQSATQARVTMRGPSFMILKVINSAMAFKINLPASSEARVVAKLQDGDLSLPQAVKLLSIDPPEVEFHFENLVKKEVPIRVPTIGRVDAELKIDEIKVVPDKILISGPESQLQDLKVVESAPLDLDNVKQSAERDLEIRLVSTKARTDAKSVKVKVVISSVELEKRLPKLPVEIRVPAGVKSPIIRPATVEVTVTGPSKLLTDLSALATRVTPYIRLGASRSKEAKIEVELPEGLHLVSVDPPTVAVLN